MGLFSRKPKEPNKSKPDDLGMLWADTAEAKQVLKKGRERKPSYRWRCCRCGAGFVLPIEPEKVPVPWWYYEALKAAGWKGSDYPWSCPGCGTFSYTVPL
jgi:rubrerythrin